MENEPNKWLLHFRSVYMFLDFTYVSIVYRQTHIDLLLSIIMNSVIYNQMLQATGFVLLLIRLVNVSEYLPCLISPVQSRHGKQSWKVLKNAHKQVLKVMGTHFCCSVCNKQQLLTLFILLSVS